MNRLANVLSACTFPDLEAASVEQRLLERELQGKVALSSTLSCAQPRCLSPDKSISGKSMIAGPPM